VNITVANRRQHFRAFQAAFQGDERAQQRAAVRDVIYLACGRKIEQAETWPQQYQEELAEYAREIQARRTGVYIVSDEERAAIG
jgi:hypothetical protein